MFIWAGSHQGDVPRAVVTKYLAEHSDVKIDFVESNNTVTYPKMAAAKKTTPKDNYVDFGFFNASTFAQGVVDHMWEPLDAKSVPNIAHVLPPYVPKGNLAAGYQTTLSGLIYNKDKVSEAPSSWTDLWNPKYKGKVSVFDYQWIPLVIAARLNGGSETNIDPGFKVWSQHGDQFKALVNSNDQLKNLLVSGDANLGYWWSSITQVWIDEGAPFGFAIPKEGAVAFPAYLATVTQLSPKQKKVAQDIINLLLEPQNAGEYGRLTGNIPLTDNAKLTDAQKSDPNLQLSLAEKAIQLDWGTMATQDATWRKRWDTEVKTHMR
jgi:putative spermidine/putrescine transport system substrate-binding protein